MNIRRILDIYVAPDCFGCETARNLAGVIRALDWPDLEVRLLDLSTPGVIRPATVFAVPTYVLDGRVISDAASKLGYLLETEVFRPLSGPERTWLAESTTMVSCERGRVFYAPEEPGEVVFILKRGRVDLYRIAPDGRKLVVATLGPHTIFGEMGLLGQGMYGCFAEATEDSLICVLSRSDLQALIRRNPEVGLLLLAELGTRLRERDEELEALAFRGLPARLATLLLREADVYGTIDGYTHQDLAERLGTYRETVSQLLGRFRHEGLVAVEPKRIRLLDRSGLEAYAES